MGRGAVALYLDTPENAEVAGGAGIPFTEGDLPGKLRSVLSMPDEERDQWRNRAIGRVRERYSWEAVADQYEKLFERLLQ
jgi:glycosyltransferase involved in cell wall biosynthesis